MFLFLTLLFKVVLMTTYPFADIDINIELVSSGPIANLTTASQCYQLIVRDTALYHVSKTRIYQSWFKGSLGTNIESILIPGAATLKDFDVSESASRAIFVTDTTISGRISYTLNTDFTLINQITTSQAAVTEQVTIGGASYYMLTSTTISEQTFAGGIVYNFPTASSYDRMTLTPNFKRAVVYHNYSSFQIVDISSYTSLLVYTPVSPPPTAATKKITFSLDSSLMLMESDLQSPIKMISLVDLSTKTVTYNGMMFEVRFFSSSNQMVIIFNPILTYIVNTTSQQFYQIPTIRATDYAIDNSNNLFTCSNNQVEQRLITIIPHVAADMDFYLPLNQSHIDSQTYNIINKSLVITSTIPNAISYVASATPASIYFLGFLNYFTMCSLYVLLNFKIPEQVFKYFSVVYQQINLSILSLFGLEPPTPQLSDQLVDQKRALFFKVSSDISSSQGSNLIIIIGNILFIVALHKLCQCAKRNNSIRILVSRQKWNMIFGHIINLMIPFTLPWTFFMLKSGIRNFGTKINSVCFLLIYFMGILFPILYFFDLIQERQKKLIFEREERKRMRELHIKQMKQEAWERGDIKFVIRPDNQPSKTQKNSKPEETRNVMKRTEERKKNIYVKKTKRVGKDGKEQKQVVQGIEPKVPKFKVEMEAVIDEVQEVVQKELTFSQLVTFQIAQQWHLCQANFLFPSLVLLSYPQIFLIVICLYTLLGVVIAFKKKKSKWNSFILSLYPFLFHVCFMIFYWCSSKEILILTEMVCFSVYVIGVFHHLLSILYEITLFVINLYRIVTKGNRVHPTVKEKSKKKQSKSKSRSKSKKKNKSKRNCQQNKSRNTTKSKRKQDSDESLESKSHECSIEKSKKVKSRFAKKKDDSVSPNDAVEKVVNPSRDNALLTKIKRDKHFNQANRMKVLFKNEEEKQ